MSKKSKSALLATKMVLVLFSFFLAVPLAAQVNTNGDNEMIRNQRPFKNNASEFSFGFLFGYYDVKDLNSRLKAAFQPEFPSIYASIPIQYQRTLSKGWILGAELILFLDHREENADVENRINYNNFKILAGKDFLKHENRRLIAFLGGGIGTSTFSSTLNNTESTDFDTMLSLGGPRNTLLTESVLWSMDFRLVYEWFDLRNSGTKYDKWSLIAGYHLPLSNRSRFPIGNSPEFRPAGPYIGWANILGYSKVRN